MVLVILTSTISASGNSSEKGKTSCSKQDNHPDDKLCCDNGDKHEESGGVNCENIACHYPSIVNMPVFINEFELSNINNFILLVNHGTYVHHIPKAVYLSIWQPPEIS